MTEEFIKDKIEIIIIKSMLHDVNFALKIFAIVPDEKVFKQTATKKLYKFIRAYYEKYQKLPTSDTVAALSKGYDELVNFMSLVVETPEDIILNKDFVIEISIDYLKRALFINALSEAAMSLDDANTYDDAVKKMQKAMEISFDIYLGMSYIDSLEERLRKAREYNVGGIKTGVDMWDNALSIGRGFLPKNIYVVSSESNLGKSIVLCNIAANALLQHKNVLFISLEMQEFFIGQRIDAILTRINIEDIYNYDKEDELKKKYSGFASTVSSNIFIKEYPPGTVNVHHIRALCNDLRLYQSFVPDIIIVDYLNLMNVARASSNEYYKMKNITEELRALSYEFNAPMVTASQLNREGYDNVRPTMATMGESMGIVHTADNIIMLSQTEEERQMGMLQFHIVKNRLGEKDVSFSVAINYNNLRIDNFVTS